MEPYEDGMNPEVEGFLRIPSVRKLLAHPQHSIELVDMQGNHLYVSTGVKELFGYTPEEFVHINGWDLTHPDDHEILLESRRGLHKGPVRIVLRGRHADGQYTWNDVRLMLHGGLVSVLTVPLQETPPDKAYWEFIDPFI